MITKKEILHLIAQSETRKAIDALLEMTHLLDNDLHHEATIQSAKYEQFKKDERTGVKSVENLEVKLNRINAALIEIVQKIPDREIEISKQESLNTKTDKSRFLSLMLLILAVASAIGVGWIILPKWGRAQKKETTELSRDTATQTKDTTLSNEHATRLNEPKAVERKKLPIQTNETPLKVSKDDQSPPHSPKDSLATTRPQPLYDRKLETTEGMTRIIKGKYQSFIDVNGVWIGIWYDDAEDFHDGVAFVKKNGKYFWIEKTGQCVKGC